LAIDDGDDLVGVEIGNKLGFLHEVVLGCEAYGDYR
jgi:hypothetical protein